MLQWMQIRLAKKFLGYEPTTWRVRPRQVKHPLCMRLGDSSDFYVFHQIFEIEQYSILNDLKDMRFVLDLGANIGFSSAWFLSRFPDSKIVAVEPDDRNVELCEVNLKPYGSRAKVLRGAVWSRCTQLHLVPGVFGDRREWGTQVSEAPVTKPTIGIQAWDVAALIDIAGEEAVDLIKIDIEEAELEVFGETANAWLPRVRNICIELHGPECQKVFFGALKSYDYELMYSPDKDLTFCRNLRPKETASNSPWRKRLY